MQGHREQVLSHCGPLTSLLMFFKSERQPEHSSPHFKVRERRANSKSKSILGTKKQNMEGKCRVTGNTNAGSKHSVITATGRR